MSDLIVEPGSEAEDLAEVQKAIVEKDERKLSKAFEDVLDEMHTAPSSSFWSAPSTSENERLEREDLEFRRALAQQVSSNLRPHGITVIRVIETGERDGYRITAADREGRRFDATLPYERAEVLSGQCGHDGLVRRLFSEVTEAILAARQHYFARML